MKLSYAALAFLALAAIATAFINVDFSKTASIIAAISVASLAVGNLFLHPPWAAPGAETPVVPPFPPLSDKARAVSDAIASTAAPAAAPQA